ncbi:MAG: Mur ligase family protein [Vicinamibacterales bacterium]|jgi:dihydrofolate synthase/folylpolyglutamate synthase|nr:Mur ligase family protein [Vicinamibacterales bacterium]
MRPLEYLFGLEFHGHKLGLDNILALADALGRPQDAYPSVAVAGTNGKGSVCAMVSAALIAAGYRTGCYTSPHLVRLEERFTIDGVPVASAELEEVVEQLRGLAGRLQATPTFFEAATAAAFELFRRRGVEAAVLEVGMGGRLDATSAATPLAGAITNIALDHQQYLGETLAEIAFEKAGIAKPGMRLVCGERAAGPRGVIAEACAARGAAFEDASEGVSLSAAMTGGVASMTLRTPAGAYGPLTLGLRGRHQVQNALVAVRLLEALSKAGVAVPAPAIERGLGEATWPGRLDWRRLAGGRRVLLDAAHNEAGAAALAEYLRDAVPGGRQPLVFGAVRDKDHAGMLRHLLPCATIVVVTVPPTPRAADPDALRTAALAIDPGAHVVVEREPVAAMDAAWASAPEISVAGSIFLLGAVLPVLESRGAAW